MKWLIASDIHGSARWCRALMDAFDREGAQRMLLLGDLLHNGSDDMAEKQAVAEMLNAHKDVISAVRGNCDSDSDLAMLAFEVEEDYLVLPVGHVRLFATHGHRYDATSGRPGTRGISCCRGTPMCPPPASGPAFCTSIPAACPCPSGAASGAI